MLKPEDMKELYEKLAADLPEAGIQRTKGTETKKGYDTDGYGYQWCVDRLNEVCFGHWRAIANETYCELGKTSTGRQTYDVGYDVYIEIGNFTKEGFEVLISTPVTPGGHISTSRADAKKGALTNAFKKAAAFLGVGASAYRGELDEDNRPIAIPVQNQKQNNLSGIKDVANQINAFVRQNNYDISKFSVIAEEILCSGYKVSSTKNLSPDLWAKIKRNIEKLLKKTEERYLLENPLEGEEINGEF